MKIRANILPAIQVVHSCLDSGLDLIGRDGRQAVDLPKRVGFVPMWGIYAPIRFRARYKVFSNNYSGAFPYKFNRIPRSPAANPKEIATKSQQPFNTPYPPRFPTGGGSLKPARASPPRVPASAVAVRRCPAAGVCPRPARPPPPPSLL